MYPLLRTLGAQSRDRERGVCVFRVLAVLTLFEPYLLLSLARTRFCFSRFARALTNRQLLVRLSDLNGLSECAPLAFSLIQFTRLYVALEGLGNMSLPSVRMSRASCRLVSFAHVGDLPGRSTAREAQPSHPWVSIHRHMGIGYPHGRLDHI
eukprot:1862061-Pleurochrysis_carterae.AAC.2